MALRTKRTGIVTMTTPTSEPFKCQAEWRHGPGHQSATRCNRPDEHDISDEHYVTEIVADWTGPDTYYTDYWG